MYLDKKIYPHPCSRSNVQNAIWNIFLVLRIPQNYADHDFRLFHGSEYIYGITGININPSFTFIFHKFQQFYVLCPQSSFSLLWFWFQQRSVPLYNSRNKWQPRHLHRYLPIIKIIFNFNANFRCTILTSMLYLSRALFLKRKIGRHGVAKQKSRVHKSPLSPNFSAFL